MWVMLKDDLKWKTNKSMYLFFEKKKKTGESRAYTSSSNLDTSLNIDDTKVEVHLID